MHPIVLKIIPAVILAFWAIRVFLRKDIGKPQILMSAGMAVAALAIFRWAEASLFVFPFFFLGLREFTVREGLSKWDWLFFVPSVVFSAIGPGAAFDIFLCIQVLTVLVWSSAEVLRYNRISAEFFDASDDSLSVPAQILMFLTAASLVVAVLMILPGEIRFHSAASLILVLFLSVILWMLGMNVDKLGRKPQFPEETGRIEEICRIGEACETAQAPEVNEDAERKMLQRVIDEKMFLDPDISLVSLAETLHTNRTYLSGSIHSCFNRNFSDFINHLRIDYALELMRSSLPDVNIKEVAMQSGYNHQQSFYRNFTQIMEMTPGTWLSRQNKER